MDHLCSVVGDLQEGQEELRRELNELEQLARVGWTRECAFSNFHLRILTKRAAIYHLKIMQKWTNIARVNMSHNGALLRNAEVKN